MSKITLNSVADLTNSTTAQTTINANSSTIQTAFDNTLSRDGTSPNQMGASLDMNSFSIINLPAPSTLNSPVRLVDVASNPTIVLPATGTSGHVVPFLDGNNTWSGTSTFTGISTFTIAAAPVSIGGLGNQNPISGEPSHIFEVVNDNSSDYVLRVSTYGDTPIAENNYHWVRMGGSMASPTATKNNMVMWSFGGRGHDGQAGSAGFTSSATAFQSIAAEDWNSTSHGSKMQFQVCPPGSVARSSTLELNGSGIILTGSITARSGSAISAGGSATVGIMMSSTPNFGVFYGSGAPTLSAAQGSLYLRSDGSSTTTRIYVNTNGSTTWTAMTTVA